MLMYIYILIHIYICVCITYYRYLYDIHGHMYVRNTYTIKDFNNALRYLCSFKKHTYVYSYKCIYHKYIHSYTYTYKYIYIYK